MDLYLPVPDLVYIIQTYDVCVYVDNIIKTWQTSQNYPSEWPPLPSWLTEYILVHEVDRVVVPHFHHLLDILLRSEYRCMGASNRIAIFNTPSYKEVEQCIDFLRSNPGHSLYFWTTWNFIPEPIDQYIQGHPWLYCPKPYAICSRPIRDLCLTYQNTWICPW